MGKGSALRILVTSSLLVAIAAGCTRVSSERATASRSPSQASSAPTVTGTRASGPVPIGPLITLSANGDGPTARLSNEFLRYLPGIPGSYCWTSTSGQQGVSHCVDVALDSVTPVAFLPVSEGSVFRLAGNADGLSATLRSLPASDAGSLRSPGTVSGVRVTDDAMVIQAPPGRYQLEVDGLWTQGRVPFYFGIQVG